MKFKVSEELKDKINCYLKKDYSWLHNLLDSLGTSKQQIVCSYYYIYDSLIGQAVSTSEY